MEPVNNNPQETAAQSPWDAGAARRRAEFGLTDAEVEHLFGGLNQISIFVAQGGSTDFEVMLAALGGRTEWRRA